MIELLTESEAATLIGCPKSRMGWLRDAGRLAFLPGRPPLYERSDLEDFIANACNPTPEIIEFEAKRAAAHAWLRHFFGKQAHAIVFTDLRASAGIWRLYYRIGRRTGRVSTRQRSRRAAEAFANVWREKLRAVQAEQRRKSTCSELWAFYMREHVEKKCADTERHFYAWAKLEPRFGTLRPNEITSKLVEEHLAARLPVKPTTVFVELSYLLASWHFAARRRILLEEDFPTRQMLDVPDAPKPRVRWLRHEETVQLFKAAAEMRKGPRLSRVERFMWLALETAGRRTALLELRWEQVDFETRVVYLNPEGRAQTKKRRASVPISDALSIILQRAHQERISNLVLDTNKRIQEPLAAVATRAGVAGVTPHVFRHTAATWMARHGVPLWRIAKFLGNTVQQIDETYAHHNPEDLRSAVNGGHGMALCRESLKT